MAPRIAAALSDPADPTLDSVVDGCCPTAVDALFIEFREPALLPLQGRSVTQVNVLEVSEANTAVGCYDLYRIEDAGRGDHVGCRERPAEGGELLVTWTADSTPVE